MSALHTVSLLVNEHVYYYFLTYEFTPCIEFPLHMCTLRVCVHLNILFEILPMPSYYNHHYSMCVHVALTVVFSAVVNWNHCVSVSVRGSWIVLDPFVKLLMSEWVCVCETMGIFSFADSLWCGWGEDRERETQRGCQRFGGQKETYWPDEIWIMCIFRDVCYKRFCPGLNYDNIFF